MRGVTLWIVLTLGPTPTLDVGGGITLTAPVHPIIGHDAITLPHLTLIDPRAASHEGLLRHEFQHQAQWDALGPAFLLAYAVGGGLGFEDYLGDGTMWIPPPDLHHRCPVARLQFEAGSSWLPCWRSP